ERRLPPPLRPRHAAPAAGPVVWAALAIGGVLLVGTLVLVVAMSASRESRRDVDVFAHGPDFIPDGPELRHHHPGREVIIPAELKAAKAPAGDQPVLPARQPAPAPAEQKVCKDCENFGTEVTFVRNPREAAGAAMKEGKLTFILHVSGNFEEARFT